MRFLAFVVFALGGSAFLSACAPNDEASRTTREAGGTVPWNRPEKWEGPGVLGSQMNSAQTGGF